MSIATVVHLLPHPGGGGERYVDLLTAHDPRCHERAYLSTDASPRSLVTSAPRLLPTARRAVAAADLVHVHGDMAAVLALPLVRGGRWIWTTHGLHFRRRQHDGPVGRGFDAGLRRVLRRAGATICTSAAERDELLELAPGVGGSRIEVIHNGVQITLDRDPGAGRRLRHELHLRDADVVALFLASLEPHKGVRDAIEAAAMARQGGAPVVLLVAGSGSLERELQAIAGPHARIVGHREPGPLLDGADIFLLPSEREGLSLALLEAMERGLAPIVSDGPGNPEAVGPCGIVVPVGDVRGFADALTVLAGDAAERHRLGIAARERAHHHFSIERFIERTGAVYDGLLMAPGPGAGAGPS